MRNNKPTLGGKNDKTNKSMTFKEKGGIDTQKDDMKVLLLSYNK